MQLSIVGCPDKKKFLPYVKRATKFYAEQLLSEKMLKGIHIRIKFNKNMVHIKQYAHGELDETLMSWKGKRVDSNNLDYYDHPWEIEAHGLEVSLFSKFVIGEKLWNVFDGINNPDGPVKRMDIIWKESIR